VKLFGRAVFDPGIADAQTRDVRIVTAGIEIGGDSLADTSAQTAVLDGNDAAERAPHLVEQLRVEGFHPAQVIMGGLHPLRRSAFRSPDRTELAKLALDYISFSISSGHKGSAQVPTEDEMRNIQGAKSRADAARRGKLDDIIKELLKEDM